MHNFNVRAEVESYRSGTGNNLCISVVHNTPITEIDCDDIRALQFNFADIKGLENENIDTKCGTNDRHSSVWADCKISKIDLDFIGIVANVWDEEVMSTGKKKRDICLTDKTKGHMIVSLWGDDIGELIIPEHIPIIIRNGIATCDGTIKCSVHTTVWFDPQIECAMPMKEWFRTEIANKK